VNIYQVDTLVRLNVTFYDVALNLPADPTAVALFVEAPDGTVTQVDPLQIARTGVGAYYSNFLPPSPGEWTYKWQGTGNVIATSKDRTFLVQASELVS
jgi:hypothetical protein